MTVGVRLAVVAVRVMNTQGDTGGLAVQLLVQQGGKWVSHGSDGTWKYNLNPFPFWNSPVYSDAGWAGAKTLCP